MARNAVVVNRPELRQLGLGVVVQPLLLTLFAVAGAIPVGKASLPPQQIEPRDNIRQNADTSRGSFKPLLTELVLPRGKASLPPQQIQPRDNLRPNGDTSRGTRKAILAELILPRGKATITPPPISRQDSLRKNADTTQGQQVTLKAPPSPIVPPEHRPPARALWQPADSSQSVAKPNTPDATPPIVGPQHRYLDRPREIGSTATGLFPGLAGIIQPPLNVAPQPGPQLYPSLPADTSRSVAEPLLPAGTPIFVAAHIAPVRFWWQPPDTSLGTPEGLRPEPSLPFQVLPPQTLARPIPVADTSIGTFPGLSGFIQPPLVTQPIPTLDRAREIVDTSQRPTPALTTATPASQGPLLTPTIIPPRFWFQPADTSQSVNPDLFPPGPPYVVVTPPPDTGAGVKHKRRRIIIGTKHYIVDNELEVQWLLSKAFASTKPLKREAVRQVKKREPVEVTVPANWQPAPLEDINPATLHTLQSYADPWIRDALDQLLALTESRERQDEDDIEMLLLNL